VNNKVHLATRLSPFMANYRKELQMEVNIRRRRKVEKVTEFIERMKRVQEEVGSTLRKTQEEMKRQADREKWEVDEWKKREKVMLSTKNLVQKTQCLKKGQ